MKIHFLKTKRFPAAAAVLLLLCLVLSACGGGSNAHGSAVSSESEPGSDTVTSEAPLPSVIQRDASSSAASEAPLDLIAPQLAVPETASVYRGQLLYLGSGEDPRAAYLAVTAEDETSEVSLSVTNITVGDEEILVPDGVDQLVFDQPGEARITVAAADAAGNVTEAVIAVTVLYAPDIQELLEGAGKALADAAFLQGSFVLEAPLPDTAEPSSEESGVSDPDPAASPTASAAESSAEDASADNPSDPEPGLYAEAVFEADRTDEVFHLTVLSHSESGNLNQEGYLYQSGGRTMVLYFEDNDWYREAVEEEARPLTADRINEIIFLPDYDAAEGLFTEEGDYVLTAPADAALLNEMLTALGLGDFYEADLFSAEARLTLDRETLAPSSLVLFDDASQTLLALQYAALSPEGSVKVPNVMTAEERKAQEEKNRSSQAPAGNKANTRVEVDLTSQTVYLYVNNRCVLSSPCVTGCVAKGMATPTGTYYIRFKANGAYLLGNAYVDYWMPFNGGIGLHDAGWRGNNFASTEAWYNGSHGCVNLPYGTAQSIYALVDAGTQVIVYGWPVQPSSGQSSDPTRATSSAAVGAYRITWLNGDGTVLDVQTCYSSSKEPSTAKVPTKKSDGNYTYTFTGWDSGKWNGARDIKTYTPVFSKTAKSTTAPASTEESSTERPTEKPATTEAPPETTTAAETTTEVEDTTTTAEETTTQETTTEEATTETPAETTATEGGSLEPEPTESPEDPTVEPKLPEDPGDGE